MTLFTRCLLGLLLLVGLSPTARATTIYYDDFDGSGTTILSGTTPDFPPGGNTWTATSSGWRANGDFVTGASNRAAVLPFVPASGNKYELSASVATLPSGNTDWLGFGFRTNGSVNGFTNDTATVGWMFHRGGKDVFGRYTVSLPSASIATGVNAGAVLSMILDTNPTNWTIDWYINGAFKSTYTYPTNPAITHVGMSTNSTSIAGTMGFFELKVVPEPTSALLMLLGALAVGRVRHRR
jgi:hypothetical protein